MPEYEVTQVLCRTRVVRVTAWTKAEALDKARSFPPDGDVVSYKRTPHLLTERAELVPASSDQQATPDEPGNHRTEETP